MRKRPLLEDTRREEYYSSSEQKPALWIEIADNLGITNGME